MEFTNQATETAFVVIFGAQEPGAPMDPNRLYHTEVREHFVARNVRETTKAFRNLGSDDVVEAGDALRRFLGTLYWIGLFFSAQVGNATTHEEAREWSLDQYEQVDWSQLVETARTLEGETNDER